MLWPDGFLSGIGRRTRWLLRALVIGVALIHLFPATKHIGAWLSCPSWNEAWKGFGAALAFVLLLLPARWRSSTLPTVLRGRQGALAVVLVLAALHIVPATDHLPKFFAAPSWGDAWRGFGACIAILWFARRAHLMLRPTALSVRLAAGVVALSLGLCLSFVGCAASGTHGFDEDGGASGGHDDGGGGGAFNADGSPFGKTDGGGPNGQTLLYAHTDTTLYSFDPNNLTAPPTVLGNFDCIGGSGTATSMTDIGVTKDGKLYGVSEVAAYPLTLQAGKVHCDATWPLPSNAQFYGLTVAPENTVTATEAVIAANSAGQLFQLDATSGTPTQVGTLGKDPQSGKNWSLSGDIVFLANGGSPVGFATVRTCSGTGGTNCSTVDTLVEVDVKAIKPGTQSVLKAVRGQVVKGSWCTNPSSPSTFGSMFGIAAFHDKVYGFSRKGDVVEINNNDGSGCLIAAYATDHFAGAGVTTTAPVQAPPPK